MVRVRRENESGVEVVRQLVFEYYFDGFRLLKSCWVELGQKSHSGPVHWPRFWGQFSRQGTVLIQQCLWQLWRRDPREYSRIGLRFVKNKKGRRRASLVNAGYEAREEHAGLIEMSINYTQDALGFFYHPSHTIFSWCCVLVLVLNIDGCNWFYILISKVKIVMEVWSVLSS